MAIFRGTGETGTGAESDFENLVQQAQDARDAAQLAETGAEQAYEDTLAIFGDAEDVTAAVASATASASSASSSATTATTAATNASNSATTATNAAASATASATTATTQAGIATTKATEATNSATSASTSATNASNSASSASSSASSASSSAAAANSSATTASNAATTATTKASEASISASTASTSATNAANSASSASSSASAAASSAASALISEENATAIAENSSLSIIASDLAGMGFSYDFGSVIESPSNVENSPPGHIVTVADNIDDVISCADNLAAIIAAPTEASNAAASAAAALVSEGLAEDWANKTTGTVDGVEYSAKYYANQAATTLASALIKTNNLSDLTNAATARTNLGLGTAATTAATDYATAAQGTKADTAYGWGNHALAGYLTVETDPVYTASSWYTTTNNSTNWNTAYSWGNHALAGYAHAGANTDILSMSGITGGISTADYLDLDTAATPAAVVGRLSWDDGNGTANITLKGGNVNLAVGQELVARVYNDSGVALTDGQVVYISGAQGNRIAVKLAKADSETTSAGTLGIVTEPIAIGAEGFITMMGTVNKLNTAGLTAGNLIYLSATTAGAYTTTAPTAPNHRVTLGYVERVHATVGSIYVKVDNGYELDELHNVLFSSVTNGDVIVYNSSTTVWENKAQSNIIAGGVTTGAITSSMLASTLDLGVLA